ncbi:ABC transporter ATP-binding protein [Salinisphaera sp. USBA-960]|uniref:ABC transporter ATP-binding protein n=1 Tax=Salinisphaera orenii TaxID=856731 RepID=UPI000DBE8A2F|nr:ABC transporter ATP-binding protein [Salifodinibacter halophilus]NNC26778.1 ABC transporter ATP-binding protein [Salifodinibacter halophilus]
MAAPALSYRSVSKHFGDFQALDDVDFDIERGSFFALLGPNGAGKSTLINITAGLSTASSGSVSVLGNDVITDYRQARRSLGVVPQELVYDPFFSVRNMLRQQAGYHGCGRDYWPWIDELLRRLELTDKRDQSIRALSGGMKRRVLIAQALVHKPDVIILDEPTAGVDVELRRTLWRFTKELNDAGHTVVLTTHYLEEAEQLCDRTAILDGGRILVLEDTRDLLGRHPYRYLSLQLDRADAVLPDAVEHLVESRDGENVEFKLETGRHHIGDVIEAVRDAGYRLNDVRTREPSLENIFVDLTMNNDVGVAV